MESRDRKTIQKLTESEKKRRKVESNARRNVSRIQIGEEIGRWNEVKGILGLKTNEEVAAVLLDRYFDNTGKSTDVTDAIQGPSTSTPARHKRITTLIQSEISSVDSDSSERTLTGVETLPETDSEHEPSNETTTKNFFETINQASTFFVVRLSIDVTIQSDEEEEADSDYEPDFLIEAVLPEELNRQAEDITFEEMELGMGSDDEGDQMEYLEEDIPEVSSPTLISSDEDCRRLTEETSCLVFLQQLLDLASSCILHQCQHCTSPVQVKHNFVGSAVYLKWICAQGHVCGNWCSQPILNRRVHSGDFLSAMAIDTSGNNFAKVAQLARFLNLKFLSSSTFHAIQRTYIVPSVDSLWERHQEEVVAGLRDQDVIALGDGRMDSPGHSAQYCTYTVMEGSTKLIVSMQCLDKRQTDRKSGNMEKMGFQLAMDEMDANGLKVTEVVTDAHLGIGALMKSHYPQIKHSNDVWHAAKNLGKKILKAGQKKDCGVLQKWSKDIVNHLWFCCKTANSYPEFMSIWRGLLHHVTDQHRWVLSHGDGVNHCLHGPLVDGDRAKPWLDKSKDAVALSALAGVVLDKRFLSRIHYLLNFRSIAELETFNQLVLMYCSKRYAYSPPVYRMRNRLAALDHNHNVQRQPRKTKQGDLMYHRFFIKKSSRWSVRPVKEVKTYEYLKTLTMEALKMRLSDKVGMKRKRELEVDDPRRISQHLAPIPPPPTSQLVAEQVTRFEKDITG